MTEEIFPNERLEKVWLWRQKKPPCTYAQIAGWLAVSRQRAQQLYIRAERWKDHYKAGSRLAGLANLALADHLARLAISNREIAGERIRDQSFFPVRTKGLRMDDYVQVCAWAGVEPQRPDIVIAWRKVRAAKKLFEQRKHKLETLESRYD